MATIKNTENWSFETKQLHTVRRPLIRLPIPVQFRSTRPLLTFSMTASTRLTVSVWLTQAISTVV